MKVKSAIKGPKWMLGVQLPNHAIVIATVTASNGAMYVLASFHNNEWVTWEMHPETGACVSGHYFQPHQLSEAARDLYERAV